MLTTSRNYCFLAALILPAFLTSLAAQQEETTAKGQVKIGVHTYRMEAGKLYQVRVDADGFSPEVKLSSGYFINAEKLNRGDTFQGFVLPTDTRDNRVVIIPSIYDDDLDSQPLDYKITFTPIELNEQLLLEEKSELTSADPKYSNPDARETYPHKAYTVQLKARQVYIITMKAAGDKEMDPYLFLESSGGKIVARDDDGGGNYDARIFIQPRRSGEYRIIASVASENLGEFTLTVQTTDEPED